MTTVGQVENDPFCVEVLEKHWPGLWRWGDIRTLQLEHLPAADVVTGGFPCQPVSQAGLKRGDQDDRWLWPSMLRVVRHLRPGFVVVENVRGLSVRGLDRVIGDLAHLGYDSEWSSIPARAVGAPHRRSRIFVVAHAPGGRWASWPGLRADEPPQVWWRRLDDGSGTVRIGSCEGCGEDWCNWHTAHRADCGCPDPFDLDERNGWWEADPAVVAEPRVGRVAYGVPHRMDRLKALGNAVVPQVAEWIGRRIMAVEEKGRSKP